MATRKNTRSEAHPQKEPQKGKLKQDLGFVSLWQRSVSLAWTWPDGAEAGSGARAGLPAGRAVWQYVHQEPSTCSLLEPLSRNLTKLGPIPPIEHFCEFHRHARAWDPSLGRPGLLAGCFSPRLARTNRARHPWPAFRTTLPTDPPLGHLHGQRSDSCTPETRAFLNPAEAVL